MYCVNPYIFKYITVKSLQFKQEIIICFIKYAMLIRSIYSLWSVGKLLRRLYNKRMYLLHVMQQIGKYVPTEYILIHEITRNLVILNETPRIFVHF